MRGNLGMFGELFWFPRQCGWKDRAEWLWWGVGWEGLGGVSFSWAVLLSGWPSEVVSLKLMEKFVAFVGRHFHVEAQHDSL